MEIKKVVKTSAMAPEGPFYSHTEGEDLYKKTKLSEYVETHNHINPTVIRRKYPSESKRYSSSKLRHDDYNKVKKLYPLLTKILGADRLTEMSKSISIKYNKELTHVNNSEIHLTGLLVHQNW